MAEPALYPQLVKDHVIQLLNKNGYKLLSTDNYITIHTTNDFNIHISILQDHFSITHSVYSNSYQNTYYRPLRVYYSDPDFDTKFLNAIRTL